MWTFVPEVSLRSDGMVTIKVVENAVLTKARSNELATAGALAVEKALAAAGIAAKLQVSRKNDKRIVWNLLGDWYMGSFWCGGRYCTYRIVEATAG